MFYFGYPTAVKVKEVVTHTLFAQDVTAMGSYSLKPREWFPTHSAE